mmetsp:Transcript_18693/g.36625  ORF Transcript_18693/g.36625 Transcript_18693/m.36625 type:complete len:586 (-) Transcript_18693:1449-3206(-)
MASIAVGRDTDLRAWSEQDVLAYLRQQDEEVARAVASRGLINGRQLEALTSEEACREVLGDRSLTRRLLHVAREAIAKSSSKSKSRLSKSSSRSSSNLRSSGGAGKDAYAYSRLEDQEEEDYDPSIDPDKHGFPPLFERPGVLPTTIFVLVTTITVLCCTVFKDRLADMLQLDSKEFVRLFLRYESIPVFMVPFTYVHIWLALYMTFYPLKFRGCYQIPGTNVGFPFGWQGIVPFKVEPMARLAVDQMTTKLLSVNEVFDRLDADKLSAELEPELKQRTARVLDTVLSDEAPRAWNMLPHAVRREMLNKSTKESALVIEGLLTDIQKNIGTLFDLESLVVDIMVEDVALSNDLFIKVSDRELVFIRDTGAYMGGLFGIGQMVLSIIFQRSPWVLPVVGLVAGAITNWIALFIIFHPVNPIRICGGRIVLQGLFLKRQPQVAKLYGHIVRHKVLTAENLNRALMQGPQREKVQDLAKKHIREAFDRAVAVVGPLRSLMGDALERIGDRMADELSNEMYDTMRTAEPYMDDAFDLERTLAARMNDLPSKDFERLLHPVFQAEEWKLVIVGGVLGALFGLFQAQVVGF